jgi:hypothetical protein
VFNAGKEIEAMKRLTLHRIASPLLLSSFAHMFALPQFPPQVHFSPDHLNINVNHIPIYCLQINITDNIVGLNRDLLYIGPLVTVQVGQSL